MRQRRIAFTAALFLAAAAAATSVRGAAKTVPIPYQFSDNQGAQWMLYANGVLQNQGGNNVFGQLGQMQVNNGGMGMTVRNGQTAKVDEKSGEIILENINVGGLQVTRRVLPNKEDGSIRYIDTFHNPGAKEATASVTYHANINWGVNTARVVNDGKRKDNNIGWVGQTGNNRGVFLGYALEGAKVTPKINYQDGNNMVMAVFTLTIPGNHDVSLVHFHGSVDTMEKAAEVLASARQAKLLANVEPAVRRTIVNLKPRAGIGDDLEVLRGDVLDVVETRSGDMLRGTLKDASYPLKTSFGRVDLPAGKVLALLTVGKQRPLQLVLTTEGEVFGGAPERDFVTLQLSSGQTVKVPASQVSRAGYRRKPDEPEEVSLTKPAVVLRTGERVAIAPPPGDVEVATRFGVIRLAASSIASVTLKSEDASVHQVVLSDGSKLSGLLTAPSFDFTLDGAAGPVKLTLPTAAIARIRPTPAPDADAVEEERPEMRCTGDDVLHGAIAGEFNLDTAFESVAIRGDQIRKIDHAGPGSPELQVTLWDNTLLTGTSATPTLPFKLISGPTLTVPLDLIDGYVNNAPKPSDDASAKVRELVAKLNDDDFKVREEAQKQLVATGPTIAPLLRELKAAQPPEAQQRIDAILGQLEK